MVQFSGHSKFSYIEDLIREGKIAHARQILKGVKRTDLRKSEFVIIANFCFRTGLYNLGLRTLKDIVRPTNSLSNDVARDEEKLEYASLLNEIGARKEALILLDEVDESHQPRVHLIRAFIFFSYWRYEDSIPSLEAYIDSEEDDYRRAVGRLNLCSALIFVSQYQRAASELSDLLQFCTTNKFNNLKTHILRMRSMIFIDQSKYEEARMSLDHCQDLIQGTTRGGSFLVRKWYKLINAYEASGKERNLLFDELIDESYRLGFWESYRDMSFRKAISVEKEDLFRKVYFGTPYSSYRQVMTKKMNPAWSLPESLLFGSPDGKWLFDTNTNIFRNSKPVLDDDGIVLKLIKLLNKDQFRPMSLGNIFNELYSGDFYDPNSSPNRVRQSLFRLRESLRAGGVPIEVIQESFRYSLNFLEDISIRAHINESVLNKNELLFKELYVQFGSKTFFRKQIREGLFENRMAFSRWAQWAMGEGLLKKMGQKKASRYILSPSKSYKKVS